MEKINGSSEAIQSEQPIEYDTLENTPPFEQIPKDLENIPKDVARVCIAQREIMNSPNNKSKRAFNIFATNPEHQDPKKFHHKINGFKNTVDSPDFWQPERRVLQEYGIEQQVQAAIKLSESMRAAEKEAGIPPTIYMLSGVSAAGKTTACKKANFPGMIYDEKPDGSRGDPIGPLATDNSKKYLYMAGGSCAQIHAESSMMMRAVDVHVAKYGSEKNGDCSEVRDKTFSEIRDVKEIIKNAKETNRRIFDLDIDVPFIVSAVGVMMRPKGSQEPHPGFKYMKDNYALMKITRLKKLGNFYPNSGLNIDYSLKCYDYTSTPKERQKEVARYEKMPDGKKRLVVIDRALFNQSISRKENSYIWHDEAKSVGDQLLTQEFIDSYCEKYINPDDQEVIEKIKNSLGVYVDENNPRTVRDIIDDNAEA